MKSPWELVEESTFKGRHHGTSVGGARGHPDEDGGSHSTLCGLTGVPRKRVWYGWDEVTCPECFEALKTSDPLAYVRIRNRIKALTRAHP